MKYKVILKQCSIVDANSEAEVEEMLVQAGCLLGLLGWEIEQISEVK